MLFPVFSSPSFSWSKVFSHGQVLNVGHKFLDTENLCPEFGKTHNFQANHQLSIVFSSITLLVDRS